MLDRGKFARSLDEWKTLWGGILQPVVIQEYPLGSLGLTLWNMVYIKARRA
jgi:hypothetical protein